MDLYLNNIQLPTSISSSLFLLYKLAPVLSLFSSHGPAHFSPCPLCPRDHRPCLPPHIPQRPQPCPSRPPPRPRCSCTSPPPKTQTLPQQALRLPSHHQLHLCRPHTHRPHQRRPRSLSLRFLGTPLSSPFLLRRQHHHLFSFCLRPSANHRGSRSYHLHPSTSDLRGIFYYFHSCPCPCPNVLFQHILFFHVWHSARSRYLSLHRPMMHSLHPFIPGTWFADGLGACGDTNTSTDYICAVSEYLFDTYPSVLFLFLSPLLFLILPQSVQWCRPQYQPCLWQIYHSQL